MFTGNFRSAGEPLPWAFQLRWRKGTPQGSFYFPRCGVMEGVSPETLGMASPRTVALAIVPHFR
jgi:hypothetical protein